MKKLLYILLFAPLFFVSSCKEDIEGCSDLSAVNFNPEATLDDNSCLFDSDGDGINDADEILGCTNDEACNFNIEATDDGDCEHPENGFDCDGFVVLDIGDELQGGILFYIDETGQHGLIVGSEDLGEFMWGCYNTTITGADGTELGTGLQNTLDIIAGCSDSPIAASVTLAYESDGYTDWYLPSINELKEIYWSVGQGSEIGNIGGFIDNWYWSSTEDEIPDAAYCFSFIYVAVGGNHREGMINVRPIRSF
jgi:hypothetical protein